jgi:hypothetical protein
MTVYAFYVRPYGPGVKCERIEAPDTLHPSTVAENYPHPGYVCVAAWKDEDMQARGYTPETIAALYEGAPR